MISKVPTVSLKRIRVPHHMVVPTLLAFVVATAFLTTAPWPTLMVVGGNDPVVLELNQAASGHLRSTTQLVVVPGAGHLFEEPGALQIVVEHARDWFVAHL